MNAPSESSLAPRPRWFELLVLAMVAIAVYLPAIHDFAGTESPQFFSDDHRFIERNAAHLESLAAPWRYFIDAGLVATPDDHDIYRPLRTLSFAVDHTLFGPSPVAYRSHNILLHALVTCLLFLLLRRTPALAAGAFLGAIGFAVHPLATEAVAWISSRADLLAALFVLLTLLAARRCEARSGAWLVTLLGALCGFAKESACVVPALVVLDHRLRRGRFERSLVRPLLAVSLGVAGFLTCYLAVRQRGITGQVEYYGGSFGSHLPYAILGLGRQLSLLIWPARFNFNHEPYLFDPSDRVALAGASVAILLAAGVFLACLRRRSPAALGLAFHAIALLPSANLVLPLRSVLAERFAYVPLLGFAIFVAALAPTAAARLRSRSGALPFVIALAWIVAFAIRTAERAADHLNPRRMYEATVRAWPDSYSAALGLGDEALRGGDTDTAISSFLRARNLAHEDHGLAVKATVALGRAYVLASAHTEAITELARACAWFDREPELSARFPEIDAEARFALGTALALSQRAADAARVYDDLLARHGETAQWLDARGEVERAVIGRTESIIDYYQRALAIDPNYHKARVHLAKFLHLFSGLEPEALRQLREVLYRDPQHEEARRVMREWEAEKGH